MIEPAGVSLSWTVNGMEAVLVSSLMFWSGSGLGEIVGPSLPLSILSV